MADVAPLAFEWQRAQSSALEATWRSATQTAQAAAAAASLAEHDRDQLSTRARRRRTELDTRITELHQQKTQAIEAAATAAGLAKALTRVPHDRAEHERIGERIATAVYPAPTVATKGRDQGLRIRAESRPPCRRTPRPGRCRPTGRGDSDPRRVQSATAPTRKPRA